MAHMKKSATGHLMKNDTVGHGHLSLDCGPPPGCNSCDPPLLDTYYVTFAGLGGSFAFFNGTHHVEWYGSCIWVHTYFGTPSRFVSLLYVTDEWATRWRVTIYTTLYCQKVMRQPVTWPCLPTNIYVPYGCASGNCPDTKSCAKSVGATCVVSATP